MPFRVKRSTVKIVYALHTVNYRLYSRLTSVYNTVNNIYMDRPIIITECHLIDGNDLIMQLISHQVHAAKYNVIFGNAYIGLRPRRVLVLVSYLNIM